MVERIPAGRLIDLVLDPGTFHSWDDDSLPSLRTGSTDYAASLAEARRRTGLAESVVTGEGRLQGIPVALAACEFDFLAGSIGVAAAERLVRCVERATDERLPLVASPASGGTRLQEGTVAFLQMVKIAAAVARHRSAGLPYLVYLRHPTTGGVLASWGSLGHVTAAQPGALIGLLGPRVYESYGRTFPTQALAAENLVAHGVLDAVVPAEELAGIAARVLRVLLGTDPGVGTAPDTPAEEEPADVPAWESVQRSRRPDRPGVRELLRFGATDVTALQGTGEGEQDPGLLIALARFGRAPALVLGQDRRRQAVKPLGAAGLREARRGLRLAGELGLPVLTVIDTSGAALSAEVDEGGIAGEIARCLAELATVRAPTLSLLLGEGGGGTALALMPTDVVVCAQHAWLAPLPPEAVAAVLYGHADRAADAAAIQRMRARDLWSDGVVDRVIPERPDAADETAAFIARVARTVEQAVLELLGMDPAERHAKRAARYRRLGLPRP
jgi:acetyl-CoA carboxylase beta subunit/acetyl-CoA carboxylase alpha subunit